MPKPAAAPAAPKPAAFPAAIIAGLTAASGNMPPFVVFYDDPSVVFFVFFFERSSCLQ